MRPRVLAGKRKAIAVFVLAGLVAVAARAQEAPSTQDGPGSGASASQPKPYPDGSYDFAPGMTGPRLIGPATAVYPAAPAEGTRVYSVFQIVVATDGTATVINTLHSGGEDFDAAAIDALKRSKFEPGTLDNHPVPIRTRVRFIFFPDQRPTHALLFPTPTEMEAHQKAQAPIVLRSVDPEYSEEARRNKIKGIVIVGLTVDEQGVPTNVHVVRGLGYGLDEKAIQCVSQYRFKPAAKDGRPVPVEVNIEVNFQLF